MTENEILLKGIVIGASAIIPFIGIAFGKWHHWKAEYMFSKMMHDDAMAQNERLFRAVKIEEDKAKYFESKLKFVIEQYKPIGPIKKTTDNNKNNAIELLKPRVMENGCEYYLAGEVRLCIEQAARQIAESNSVYKELDSIIEHQKYKRCLAKAQEWRNYATVCGMQSHCHNHRGFGKTAEKYDWKESHGWKCVRRWRELAKKFNLTRSKKKMKATKKPVTIEFFKYDGDLKNRYCEYYVPEWAVEAEKNGTIFFKDQGEMYIKTLEGDHHASVGDYIIRGVNGELYPCKPDIFKKTYDITEKADFVMEAPETTHGFDWAIQRLKAGEKVQRKGWNGKSQYIELATSISYKNAKCEIINCNHDAIGNKALAFVGTSGVQMGWLASQADMLAEDWMIAE